MITDINLFNVELTESIKIGTDKSQYILSLVDFGQAEVSRSTTSFINLIGENVDATKLNPRPITIKGTALPEGGTVSDKKTRLNRMINPNHTLIITYANFKIVAKPNSTVKFSTEPLRNNERLCDFLIQATAYVPVFKRINEEVFYYSEANKVPLFPLKIPKNKGICFGKISTINTTNVLNDGDIEAGFIIRFIAYKGAVVNPKITNNKTGKFIEVIVSMEKGDIVEVSTETGNKYAKFIRGTTETDIFRNVSKKSTMSMTLNTGVNDLAITAAQNASNLNNLIKFVPLYLEVQE